MVGPFTARLDCEAVHKLRLCCPCLAKVCSPLNCRAVCCPEWIWKRGPMQIEIGVNMEFIRSEDKSFEEGVRRAAALGYKWVEPMVHNGRELLSEAGYFHSFSMDNDPLEMKDILDRYSVRPSGLSSHCLLMAGDQRALPREGGPFRRRDGSARSGNGRGDSAGVARGSRVFRSHEIHPEEGSSGGGTARHFHRHRTPPEYFKNDGGPASHCQPGGLPDAQGQLRYRQCPSW